jgi:hypothetical protein
MRKNKHKKTCEKDKNTSGKWLTDDTVSQENQNRLYWMDELSLSY